MTSIEWLYDELAKNNNSNDSIKERIYKQSQIWKDAKEMHKQEMKIQFGKGQEWEHKNMITSDDTQVSKTFLENVPKQETLYTEEQATEFAKWLAANWFPMWVKDKFVWEHDWDKTCEEQKYQGYYNEKDLFELFLSLKQPKKD
jgi:hypothetical protein